jgi:hypothetical protein
MFSVPTVFVIGAGAGVEIEMPVGSELSREVGEKLNITHKDHGSELKSGDAYIAAAMHRIAKAKGENYNDWRAAGCSVASGIEYTRSIDAYLNTHKDNDKVKVCGKLAITQAILAHERQSAVYVEQGATRAFRNRTMVVQSWLSDFLYVIQDGIIASENLDRIFTNLCIIIFNYDRCVEQFLLHALRDLYLINETRAFELMRKLKIFHPYGRVGYMPWATNGLRQVDFGVTDYGDIVGLAEEIRTYNEQLAEESELKTLREEVGKAERIVFLGFHFHSQNMELLKASGPGRGGTVNSYATAVDRSEADKTLLNKQIRDMLADRGGSWNVFVERDCNCKKLFKDYGATWLR